MPLICYKDKSFNDDRMFIIHEATRIITKFTAQGYDLTLRQLYYQFVAHDLFPDDRTWRWTGSRWVRDPNGTKNATPNYTWLGSIINEGRMAGLIDWSTIVDRTRELKQDPKWKSPTDILKTCASQFQFDKWALQDYRPEVWIEKDALIGVIEGVCDELQVPYFSCRGYTSQSEMWGASQRLRKHLEKGQVPFIIHLGDHDPSGIDMSRDVESRLKNFLIHHNPKYGLGFFRIALNMDQVEEYDPPPNPAKLTDSRAVKYIDEYGGESWELDALEPQVMNDLIRDAVSHLRDDKLWDEEVRREFKAKEALGFAARKWNHIQAIAEKGRSVDVPHVLEGLFDEEEEDYDEDEEEEDDEDEDDEDIGD